MQLVGLLAREQTRLRNRAPSVARKWSQMQAARALESTWSKVQILEAYVNLASFRGEVSGIGAASRSLLNKSPAGLDSTDSLLLVSLLRSPNATATAIGARGCRLIDALNLSRECAAFDALTQRALATPPQ